MRGSRVTCGGVALENWQSIYGYDTSVTLQLAMCKILRRFVKYKGLYARREVRDVGVS